MKNNREKGRVGFFAVVHNTYFDQFEGLRESLMHYHRVLAADLAEQPIELVDYGMIETSEQAYELLQRMQGDSLDMVFCNMITYATSSVFAPIIRDLNMPVVLLALQPLEGLDYSKASTYMQLENDNICAVPEFVFTANRMGKKVADVIVGYLYNDKQAQQQIAEWCRIANVLHAVHGARIGLMGHVMEAMYDMHTDPTALSAAFGLHVPLLEIEDLIALSETVTAEEIEDKKATILNMFDTPVPKSDPVTRQLTPEDLESAARSAVALDKLVEAKSLTGLAYYYEGKPGTPQQAMAGSLIVGNSLLNARGVPMCGEYDIKTCVAMLILDRLGIGGSFAELHPFDFREDFILVGHDGPHHIEIADGRPVLRSLTKYHGKPGSGASVEFKIKEGPVTMMGLTQTASGSYRFIIGEGVSKKGPIPPTGNTNTRCFFEPSTREFVRTWVMQGATHHFALGVGHHAETLRRIADCLGIESVIVKG